MNLKFSFSWLGLIIFILPMLINIIYAIFPHPENSAKPNKIIDIIENISRVLYLIVMVIFVSNAEIDYLNAFMFIALLFLILYYIVWIRYFIGNRDASLMSKSFLFIPIPLAVFPVLYFIFAAIWVKNIPAVIIMIIFGVAHNINAHISFKK